MSKIYVSLSFYYFMKGMVNVAAVQQSSYGYTWEQDLFETFFRPKQPLTCKKEIPSRIKKFSDHDD